MSPFEAQKKRQSFAASRKTSLVAELPKFWKARCLRLQWKNALEFASPERKGSLLLTDARRKTRKKISTTFQRRLSSWSLGSTPHIYRIPSHWPGVKRRRRRLRASIQTGSGAPGGFGLHSVDSSNLETNLYKLLTRGKNMYCLNSNGIWIHIDLARRFAWAQRNSRWNFPSAMSTQRRAISHFGSLQKSLFLFELNSVFRFRTTSV